MNPLTNVKNINKLNEIELSKGTTKSWHDMYKDSAWIFIGGLAYGLTEGDILAVFSQYGEIVNLNLVRDKKTGKTKGFCFLCYANQKSTTLAVDNFNGIKLCNRTIRVDHVANYKPPKEDDRDDEITKMLKSEGCAPTVMASESGVASKLKLEKKKKKKMKKEKKEHKKKKRKPTSDESDNDGKILPQKNIHVKKEKHDPGYDKYDTSLKDNFSIDERQRKDNKFGEGCSTQDKYMLEMKERDHTNQIKENKHHQSRSIDKERSKDKSDRKYEKLKESLKVNIHEDANSKKRYFRKHRSSSEDNPKSDRSRNNKTRKDQPEDKYLSKKHHKSKYDSTSSSDDHSSSDSSSDNEENNQSKSSKKYPCEASDDKRSQYKKLQSRRRHCDDDFPSKSKHCDQNTKMYSDYKSKRKHNDEERYDKYNSSSSHHNEKDKYGKR